MHDATANGAESITHYPSRLINAFLCTADPVSVLAQFDKSERKKDEPCGVEITVGCLPMCQSFGAIPLIFSHSPSEVD
jgi:hypothetical protein